MKQPLFYALDFDGVICDSAVETAITGWKAALTLWNGFNTPLPSENIIEQFRCIRPLMETGYEAILIIYLLHQGNEVDSLLLTYDEKIQQAHQASNKNIAALKQLFGEIRDQWIHHDVDDWVQMNPLFSNVAKKLHALNEQQIPWVVVTTKQERFVAQILKASGVELATDKIFGLDRKMSKEAILTELLANYPRYEFHFIEDRLPALVNVLANPQLNAVTLLFATWGYNTAEDKQQASLQSRIRLIDLPDFL
ncbi:MAG: HAD family hydrolase [Methylococcales bacterium]|nr:HAD family hydrolase [Methylococcales bacterium]